MKLYRSAIAAAMLLTAAASHADSFLGALDTSSRAARDGRDSTTFAGSFGTDANEAYGLTSMFLPGGNYRGVISAINTPDQASYPGNASSSAVPEPQSYALFVAGLAVLVVMARRRKRDSNAI